MKTITVYGPGCAKCKQTEELVRRVVAESGVEATVVKVSDINDLIRQFDQARQMMRRLGKMQKKLQFMR